MKDTLKLAGMPGVLSVPCGRRETERSNRLTKFGGALKALVGTPLERYAPAAFIMGREVRVLYACLWVFITFPSLQFTVQAQDLPKRELDLKHYIAEWEEDEEVMEDLFALLQNPIDLNTAEREELEKLFFLRPGQATELLEHRQRFGAFLSLYELQVLSSFTVLDILNLQPFVVLTKNSGRANVTEHYLIYRTDLSIERSKGFRDSVFAGGPTRQYFRYKFQRGNRFSLALLTEKDPGEKSIIDHQVISLQWKNLGPLKHLIVGDYQVHWGQGLMVGAGFKLGKGAEPVLGTKRGADGFSVRQSVKESGGFRGGAIQWGRQSVQMGAWVSQKRIDANRIGDQFSSIQSAGLHRTSAELQDEHSVGETHAGSFFTYKRTRWQVGIAGLFTRFNAAFKKQDLPYNYFQFRGKNYGIGSVTTTFYGKNYVLFGELAYANAVGAAGGLALSATKQWEIGVHLRYYPEDFHSLYGSAFGENTLPQNEIGQYLGLKFTPRKSLTVSGHYDRYRFPWVKFGESTPVHGGDYALRIIFQPKKSTLLKLVFRCKSLGAWQVEPSTSRGVQVIFDRKWMATVHTQTAVHLKSANGWGQAWMQDLEGRWKWMQWRSRIAWFSTSSYDARIYTYENDVLYTSSFPAYYGKGLRLYVNVKVAISKRVDVWVRWARTSVEDKIGSGWDELEGGMKTDFRVQVRYAFH